MLYTLLAILAVALIISRMQVNTCHATINGLTKELQAEQGTVPAASPDGTGWWYDPVAHAYRVNVRDWACYMVRTPGSKGMWTYTWTHPKTGRHFTDYCTYGALKSMEQAIRTLKSNSGE